MAKGKGAKAQKEAEKETITQESNTPDSPATGSGEVTAAEEAAVKESAEAISVDSMGEPNDTATTATPTLPDEIEYAAPPVAPLPRLTDPVKPPHSHSHSVAHGDVFDYCVSQLTHIFSGQRHRQAGTVNDILKPLRLTHPNISFAVVGAFIEISDGVRKETIRYKKS